MIQEINFFVNDALPYIKERLSYGGKLAKMLLNTLNLDNGNISIYLPENLQTERYLQFEYGGIFHNKEAEEKLANLVFQFIKDHEENYVIFQEALASMDTLWSLDNTKNEYITHANEVYYLLNQDSSLQYIMRMLGAARYPGIGILTSHKIRLTNRQSITTSDIEELARNTRYILVDAYDQESYLIWTRKSIV